MEPVLAPARPSAGSIWRRLGERVRRPRGAAVDCEACGSGFACPIEWSMAGASHWLVDFRCGECGAWMAIVLTNAQAARLECVLARQAAAMRRAAEGVAREEFVSG